MAAEAEATREARAKVIAAEGEQKASKALKAASDVIAKTPSALQLRYLQTLTQISTEKNSSILFPVPIDLISNMLQGKQEKRKGIKQDVGDYSPACCFIGFEFWRQSVQSSTKKSLKRYRSCHN